MIYKLGLIVVLVFIFLAFCKLYPPILKFESSGSSIKNSDMTCFK